MMAISQQLLMNPGLKVIGFAGGKGRNYLLNLLAGELVHSGKKVVISNIGKDVLAPSGHILYNKDESKLLKVIKKEILNNPLIYAGTELKDYMISGISNDTINELKASSICDHLLLILGNEEKRTLFSKREISSISHSQFLDEFIYCFQLDLIDQPLNSNIVNRPDELFKRFPQHKSNASFNQELIVDYLSDKKNGALRLFQQEWPTFLIFTDINNVFLENRTINLTRDLVNSAIDRIYWANLKENMIIRISK
jgi:hypothetical protein